MITSESKRELQNKVRELEREAEQIDGKIQEIELKAAREEDEARVVELLAERSRLQSRKEAIPFLLRGIQSRALHSQKAALLEEAASVKADLDDAVLEFEAATKRVPELQQQLDQAVVALAEAERHRDKLAKQHYSLESAAGSAGANARAIERGEPATW
jgi:DNA repair exonuclease SbcCD ATPase subunit